MEWKTEKKKNFSTMVPPLAWVLWMADVSAISFLVLPTTEGIGPDRFLQQKWQLGDWKDIFTAKA